ncbi:hypothetical protein B5M42_005280 [Paenibacillus athensensis]|uniref:Uncharacterized protein n=1 Tax=Paenibacillus athensensis TaxID=1967502 RepID=A0A4Y8Q1Z0_9BACL|nr:hypothetical protein [Paenibacillus athensensis]MCD1258252.1 hypothetical protein [Paenibacillus athensensis]
MNPSIPLIDFNSLCLQGRLPVNCPATPIRQQLQRFGTIAARHVDEQQANLLFSRRKKMRKPAPQRALDAKSTRIIT